MDIVVGLFLWITYRNRCRLYLPGFRNLQYEFMLQSMFVSVYFLLLGFELVGLVERHEMFSTLQAGADASFIEAPRSNEELKEIGKRTKGYRVCNMIEGGITPLHTPEELKEMGFHLIVHPLTTLYASARAMLDVLKTLKENGSTRNELEKMATFEEFNELVNLESWFELEARYSNVKN